MGLYTITTRADGTVLTGEGSTSNIWNVDHENHVTHTEPDFINSWEENVTQMDIETNPMSGGSVSLPESLGDEIERIRYVLSQLKASINGGVAPQHWYRAIAGQTVFVNLPPIAARIQRNAALSVPDNNSTGVTFDTTIYNTLGTTSTPALVALVAPVTGVYIVGGSFFIDTAIDVNFRLRISRSGSAIGEDNIYSGATAMFKGVTTETIARFEKDQVLQMSILQSSGGAVNSSTNVPPALWMALIGR